MGLPVRQPYAAIHHYKEQERAVRPPCVPFPTWTWGDSNPQPSACKAVALPLELQAQNDGLVFEERTINSFALMSLTTTS